MDSIKEAFRRVKEDIELLKEEIDSLRVDLAENNEKIVKIIEKLNEKTQIIERDNQRIIPTHQHINPTNQIPIPTHNLAFKPLKTQNLPISIGNSGVPTDRQTDRQTDQHIENTHKNTIETATEILNSLDSIKKEIRLRFKSITDQELLIFSTIYQQDEEIGHSNYKTIAQRLNLTESSIRDYVGKLIKKGIPVEKKRINNKNIYLSISENLKKIASLATILKLREI